MDTGNTAASPAKKAFHTRRIEIFRLGFDCRSARQRALYTLQQMRTLYCQVARIAVHPASSPATVRHELSAMSIGLWIRLARTLSCAAISWLCCVAVQPTCARETPLPPA